MKSMSMVDQGMSRLYCVCRCSNRLAELLEAVDPHLRRRKRVAPGDQADAFFGVIRFLAKRGDGVRRNHHGLENHLDRNGGSGIEGLGDLLRMLSDGLEGLRPVKVLAAGDKPNFALLKIRVHELENSTHDKSVCPIPAMLSWNGVSKVKALKAYGVSRRSRA